LLDFDFGEFAEFLSRGKRSAQSCYYVGKIRQDGSAKTKSLFDGQQKLLGRLKKFSYRYSFGYLLKNGGVFHEKGVDVQIAVDMMTAAYENLCDRIILVSSDTDLAPAIRKAREKGKIVEYVGFSHKPSVAMVSFCTESRLLTKDEIERFIKPMKKN